jgi:DNA-binding transcriptional MerR regulator/effector-binding domain-containing protein
MRNGKYKIGEFARILGVSTKTLRFYDQKKILSPAFRDEHASYRYYTEEQMLDASLILQMKALGFSLQDMSRVLAERTLEAVEQGMALRIATLQSEISQRENQLQEVLLAHERLKNSLDLMTCALPPAEFKANDEGMTLQAYPRIQAVYTRYESPVKIGKPHGDRIIELQSICKKERLSVSGPMTAILHGHYTNQFLFETGDVEVFFPILSIPEHSEHCKAYEGFLGASLTHFGVYDNLLQTYVRLVKAIDAACLEIVGPCRETYHIGMNFGHNPDKFVTGITFPVARREDGQGQVCP